MKQKRKSDVAVLLDYAGSHKGLTFLGLALSAVSMLLSMAPYICIWLAARDLIAVAPDWTAAQSVAQYGWLAFAFAVAGIILYFAGLMCTHLAAFRTASNIRKQGVAHVMKAPLGFFDSNASGLIRGRLDAAAADTETLLAHNLADIVGTITLFVAMLVMMFVFDWRMGAACLLAAVISIVAMFSMPDTPIRQPDLHRGGLCVLGACGPVPGAGCPGRGRLCGVCHELRLLRGVLRHHLHGPCQNHVCRIGHYAGWHRSGPH